MAVKRVHHENSEVTLEVTINLQGSLLEVEQRIQDAVNAVGCEATGLAIRQHDTDGSPIKTGDVKWTCRGRHPKAYQTPYGDVKVERHVYQTSRGGRIYVPLDNSGRIIGGATPRFAQQVSNKYARLNAGEVCADLLDNHGRKISRGKVQSLADCVGSIAQLKQEVWSYQTPKVEGAVSTVMCSLDGAYLLTVDDGWREAMVGTLSLYNSEGQRQHTTYFGAAPEYGKAAFLKRYLKELSHIKALYPNAYYLGTADGASDNWSFLCQHTDQQILDYFHATEYLAKVAHAAYPQKTGKPKREQWLTDRCHALKHDVGAAQTLLDEFRSFRTKRKLSQTVRKDLEAAITYFDNQMSRMDYAAHVEKKLPIGSGVTEAACKTLVKQRFCCSGMRWKEAGIKTVMSLRSLVQTKGRWTQFWEKIGKYGVPSFA